MRSHAQINRRQIDSRKVARERNYAESIAAKRRKNAAHGASRGWSHRTFISPEGAKETSLNDCTSPERVTNE